MAQLLIDKAVLERMTADHERQSKKEGNQNSLMVLTFDAGVEIPKEFFFLDEDAPLEVNASEYDAAHKETARALKKVQQGLDKEARLRADMDRKIADARKAGRNFVLKTA